jgi:sec-independent protein translocase protein TatC
VVLSIGLWATGAYFIQHHIVAALLKPAANQEFIYTSVGGGIDFLFRICIYTGLVCSIPVIFYQILKYLEPLIKKDAVHFMATGSIISGVLAVAGMAFGYFIGLPAALHFLLHQFTIDNIQPLLTIQSYLSFVSLYMVGSALLFQLPLLLVLINRIKPLNPKKLLGMERWVILIAFILGGIMNPSPRVQDQVLLAGPMIITYQIGILLIWLEGRRKQRPPKVRTLLEKDEQARAERLARFQTAQDITHPARSTSVTAAHIPIQKTPVAAHPVLRQSKPTPIKVTTAKVSATPVQPAAEATARRRPGRATVHRDNNTDAAQQPQPLSFGHAEDQAA